MAHNQRKFQPTEIWNWQRLLPTKVLTFIATSIVIVVAFVADRQSESLSDQDQRRHVRDELGILVANLEGRIRADAQLIRGLVSTISTEPDMSQERFAELSAALFGPNTNLRSVAGAPDLQISMVYPIAGNEAAIGLDYKQNQAQRAAALMAKEVGDFVLAGPIELIQGGQAFVGRFPVIIGKNENTRFWGLVAAVIDLDRLYKSVGLIGNDGDLQIAIRGKDAQGPAGEQFFGETVTFMNMPELAEVKLPHGSWQIAAVPVQGWGASTFHTVIRRIVITVAGLLVVLPMFGAGMLAEQRRRSAEQIQVREEKLNELSERLELALATSKVGVWELSLGSGELIWDNRMNELYGLPADGGIRRYADWHDALHPEDRKQAEADFSDAIQNCCRYESEFRVVAASGEHRTIRAIGALHNDEAGNARILGVNWDVTADKALQERLVHANLLMEARNQELESAKKSIEFAALHDALTGLPNRRYLDEYLDKWSENSPDSRFALLTVDLDRFKHINDTLGHAAGDAVLVHVSKVLSEAVGPGDFVARIGGDEFVVVCQQNIEERHLFALSSSLIEKLRQPIEINGSECRFGISIGIADNRDGRTSSRQLLVNADIALYRAKSNGRNRYEYFTRKLQSEAVHNKKLADEILLGIDEGEFIPFYQAKFDARTRKIIGVEALVRWNHPSRGILAPDVFMNTATDLNVMNVIDQTILEQSLVQLTEWQKIGFDVPNISVNVSAKRLHDGDLISRLKILAPPPGKISFELVESIYFDDASDHIVWTVDQLKELGIDIEIDDFGTGHASIVGLLKLRPKKLKIDRHLVAPVVQSSSQRRLVQSMIEIGKSLGIEVIAEGVETHEHADIMEKLGCDALQGFAFARPVPASDLVQMTYFQSVRIPEEPQKSAS